MKHPLFLLALLLFSPSLFTQNYFDHIYNFGDIDHPVSVVTDSLENIYVCGWYEDDNQQAPHAFVLKTDASGQELWRVTLSDTSKFYALCLTHTGSLALAGSRNNHCFTTSLDGQNGTENWNYEEPGSEDYWFATINEVLDSSVSKLHVVKTKYGPHRLWYYLFDPLNGSLINYVKDNINTIYGITYTSSLIDSDRVWTAGNLNDQWGLIVNENFGPGISSLWDFQSLHIAGVHHYMDNQGCVVRNFIWPDGEYDMSILIMDYELFEVWGNSFEIAHNVFSVTGSDKYENGKFVITGTIENELALWFIDHDLTEMDDKTIPTQKPRSGIDVVALPSTDMILMGSEEEDNGTDLFLMKLDQNGLVSTGENKLPNHLSIYPNPANDKIFIKNGINSLQTAKAKILNSLGCTVKTISNLNRPVPVSDLPSGLYVVVVYNSNKLMYREKFIKK